MESITIYSKSSSEVNELYFFNVSIAITPNYWQMFTYWTILCSAVCHYFLNGAVLIPLFKKKMPQAADFDPWNFEIVKLYSLPQPQKLTDIIYILKMCMYIMVRYFKLIFTYSVQPRAYFLSQMLVADPFYRTSQSTPYFVGCCTFYS